MSSETVHYPKCNEHCRGDSHYLAADPEHYWQNPLQHLDCTCGRLGTNPRNHDSDCPVAVTK